MTFFGKTFQTLDKSLDYASIKNQTIANNLANVDTPNYKSKNVQFKDVFHSTLQQSFEAKRTNSRHLTFSDHSNPDFKITTQSSTNYRHDGNNVDVDKEMSELAKNQIYYQALVDRMNGKFNSMQSVIRGGN
ncbi:flagellar basal body rod protein FlgB [Gracilibacillus sp. YIM 98692]|uniref:flagellar basal body rod protein FlgB n=1 Tax=Gracilibacillus sp. YIM 98692 TaxID=2663532 RepID=UPI0013D723A5|nr:flagellar basal body rod protein FlgB [Gracilibacillus sp. YIM 98692]